MLNHVIRLALQHRLLVIAASLFVVVYGSLTLSRLPIDVFPDITKPTVTIMTEAHGLAPEEVESRVTLPLETFLNGLPGFDRVRSQSGIGLSVIFVEFDWGSDIYRSRQLVQEKLTLAAERLPRDVRPVMAPVGSLMGQIQQIALTSDNARPMELRNLAEWILRPRLMTIPGVAQVISIGGGLKQYQIQVSADKLNARQISLDQLDHELAQISQNTTGGFLEQDGRELLVRNLGVVESIEDIEKTVVGLHFGRPVLVKDIARVLEAPKLKRGDGSFNDQDSVVLTIQKQPGADTVSITRAVEKALDDIGPTLPRGVKLHPDVFKQSNFIEASIHGILGKLKLGSVLVFLVLLVFLANLRMSIITLTAIPLSFLVTAIVFKILGLTVNTMTLGGLAIAIGELVDDSIVDVENVFRRLGENAKSRTPAPVLRVVYEASKEVRNSIVLATMIIALVFLPLFNLDGLEGRLFTPLATAYLTALVASLVVALTLTPVLCSFFLKSVGQQKTTKRNEAETETRLVRLLKAGDRRLLEWALPHAKSILTAAALLFLGAASLIPRMGHDFLPQFNEATAMVSLVSKPGLSLAESNRVGRVAERTLLQIPEVRSVSRRTGRAEMDEHAMGVNVSEIDLDFKNKSSFPEARAKEIVLHEIRENLKAELPGVGVNVGQPISHLIDHMLSGVNAALAIKIFGPELTTLREKSTELRDLIQDIPGLVDLRIEQQGLIPQLKIQVLRDEAAKYGLSAGEITKLLEVAFNGEAVAQILEGTRTYDVFFQFDESSRSDQHKMQKTVLKVMPDGHKVLLEEVADVYEAKGPNEINRENGQRRILISANVSGRDLGGVVAQIQERLQKSLPLDEAYYVVYGGQFESQQAATRRILIFGVLALVGVAFVLFTHFHTGRIVTQIMVTIPLAFVGGLILLYLTDRAFTVASLVGFITLCGVASRNSIMMISHYLHLMKFEGEKFSSEMIIRGSQERLVPVLMTAAVTSLALLPLVFAKGEPGSEILHPVAVVIVGGLVSSTLLDILVTPLLFALFGKRAAAVYFKAEDVKEEVL